MIKTAMTFSEIIESEYYYLIEAIEHDSSDPEIVKSMLKELKDKTGYIYILESGAL